MKSLLNLFDKSVNSINIFLFFFYKVISLIKIKSVYEKDVKNVYSRDKNS